VSRLCGFVQPSSEPVYPFVRVARVCMTKGETGERCAAPLQVAHTWGVKVPAQHRHRTNNLQ